MHYVLMREMHWTWDDLEHTPDYVQRYCWDFLQATWENEAR